MAKKNEQKKTLDDMAKALDDINKKLDHIIQKETEDFLNNKRSRWLYDKF
jgi:hypothetical protein